VSNLYESYAFYTSSGSGATGLTVGCDVYSASGSFLVSNNPAVEIGGGFYKFTYDAPVEDSYLFKFRCGNAGVDSQQIGALYANKIEIPQSVWGYADRQLTNFGNLVDLIWSSASRTLSSFGSLVSDIWSNPTRSITDGGGASASSVWTYSTRELTSGSQSMAESVWSWPLRSLSQVSITDGHLPIVINSPITFETFATNSVTIEGVSDEAEIFFTVKKFINEPDHKAIIQISKTGGLLRLNQKDPSDLGLSPTNGSLVVISGNAIVALTTAAAPVIYGTLQNEFVGEIKVITSGNQEYIVTQMPVFVKPSVTHTV
jgi:hypothetical protein